MVAPIYQTLNVVNEKESEEKILAIREKPKHLSSKILKGLELCPHLYGIAHINPAGAKNGMHDILNEKHAQFEKNIKVYPNLYTLSLFKLVSLLYPTSDFWHPTVTPCLVFMGQILLTCNIKKKTDISKSLFVCSLILECTKLSKRWSPAAMNSLRGGIYISLSKPFSEVIKVVPPFESIGGWSNVLVLEKSLKYLDTDPKNVKMQAED